MEIAENRVSDTRFLCPEMFRRLERQEKPRQQRKALRPCRPRACVNREKQQNQENIYAPRHYP